MRAGADSVHDAPSRWVTLQPLALFVLVAAAFWMTPVRDPADSRYSLLLSESLLRGTGFALDRYLPLPLDPAIYPGMDADGLPYQIVREQGHLYYLYPPGSSLLSLPFVALLDRLGVSVLRAGGRYDFRAERFVQGLLASALMAGLTVVLYLTGRMLLPPLWSLGVALGSAFGTSVWSTASRVLWSHTWEIVLLGFVVLLLVRLEVGRDQGHPIVLATLLAWCYFTRPLSIIPLLAVGVFLVLFQRHLVPRFALATAAWLAAFVALSWSLYGTLLPPYYRESNFQLSGLPSALAAHLVSPSRGLLVFTPAVLFIGYLLARYRAWLPVPRLVGLALVVVGVHLAAISSFGIWWAGESYGPRYTTDLVPWFALLAMIGLSGPRAARGAEQRGAGTRRWRRELAAGLTLAAISIAMHAPAALSPTAVRWSADVDIDQHPERVWDWSRPQFLAGFVPLRRSSR